MDTGHKVARRFAAREHGVLEHPGGASLIVDKDDPLEHDTDISLAPADTKSLALASNAFGVSVSRQTKARLRLSLPLDLSLLEDAEDGKILPFIEVRDHLGSSIVAAEIAAKADQREMTAEALRRSGRTVHVEAGIDLAHEHLSAFVGAGAVVFPTGTIPTVFHPVPHHFKMNEATLQAFLNPSGSGRGPCRRANSADANGVACKDPGPANLYPACYPTAWAILCSAHRTTPAAPRRRWEAGTPLDANPPPRAWGDPLSTWAMGDSDIGATPPPVARVADWRADASDPTPDRVRISSVPKFLLDGSGTLADQIARRAELIKAFLVRIVGGGRIGGLALLGQGLDPPRPVKIGHPHHAWVIVGVEPDGYWSHAQNNDAWGFTDFTAWSQAVWAAPKPVVDEHDLPWYEIQYLPDTELKPEERRLGSIGFWESSDVDPRTGFYEVDLPYSYEDASGAQVETVLWTARTQADETGYTWIESNVPLTREGLPETSRRDASIWDPVFGRALPLPAYRRADCGCGLANGCSRCRLRMQLHFWVLNTLRDERATYRVDLELWSREGRWVDIPAQVIGAAGDPGPGDMFEIVATRDLNADGTLHTAPGRRTRTDWNGRPLEWWLDLDRDLLGSDNVHGVRLTLSCVSRGAAPTWICRVQDVKQLWFRVREATY